MSLTPIEQLRQKIELAKPVSWADLAEVFNQDQRTIRRWIIDNCPGVKIPGTRKLKKAFSPAEAKEILEEWIG